MHQNFLLVNWYSQYWILLFPCHILTTSLTSNRKGVNGNTYFIIERLEDR